MFAGRYNYASAEFKIRLLDKLTGVFIFDYETNAFTSRRIDDEHLGASENVYQGEIELLYELNESATVKLGWQHGSRKLTTEQQSIKNNNVWLGLEYVF
jgi:Putative beta-barrel porin 2